MKRIFQFFGVSPGKRYNVLDNLYVEHLHRFTEAEARRMLEGVGFKDIRRMPNHRYRYDSLLSRFIHGEGWIQICAQK